MPQRYTERILSHIADTRYATSTVRELADALSVPEEEFALFREAVAELAKEDQVVLGAADTIALPPPGREMVGKFRLHERGFGFVIPDELTQHGDLFVPQGRTGDALTGDRVRAKVRHDKRRAGGARSPFIGQVVEILQRADREYVGTLIQRGSTFLVQVDGRLLHEPVIVRDPHAKNAKPGDKVVIEIIEYPETADGKTTLGEAVITEVLGEAGLPDVETASVMRAYGLKDKFPAAVADDARAAARSFDEHAPPPPDREDLTKTFILTIDPPDAKDFDDAISIEKFDSPQRDGAVWELGVHIADVAHFIKIGSALEEEAYQRGNSTYLPRRVVPMLPEILSNGVCSLQPGVNRYAKSCFMRFDGEGHVLDARFSRSVIHSAKRLTYLEAQALIDGDIREAMKHAKTEPNYPKPIPQKLKLMDELAKVIRQRRLRHGMIVLSLPEVELIFDESGRVADAEPEDNAFTHKLIEMFMVEANEAAARLFDGIDVPMVRRIHPDPDAHDLGDLRHFARVAGYNIPAKPTRHELQTLLDSVRGKPAEHAVHLAVLKTLSKAEYAPLPIGHFALASDHYTHFTSPIRRYPDLIVHRGIDAVIDAHGSGSGGAPGSAPGSGGASDGGGRRKRDLGKDVAGDPRVPDEKRMIEIGRHCSQTERNSESAERELRTYLVLELLSNHLGDDFEGTVTGVTGSGAFVQIDKYLVDGFVPLSDLPGPRDERWRLNSQTGALVAQRSGRAITIGNRFTVRIAEIDLTRRRMELVVVEENQQKGKAAKQQMLKKPKKRRQPPGAKKAHEKAMKLKRSKRGRK